MGVGAVAGDPLIRAAVYSRAMRLAARARSAALAPAILVALGLATACGTSDDDGGALALAAPTASTLRWDGSGPFRINPGSRLLLSLRAPSGGEPARVWLDGAYLDASLDRGVVDLASGTATVALSAPSSATTFAVRARQGASTTRLEIAVTPEGTATLQVTPSYDGPREATSFVASVYVGRSCASLTDGALPDTDGSPRTEGPKGETLILPAVPAGEAIAVLVRTRRYAAGCVDLGPLEVDSVHALDVTLYRRDLDMNETFDASLSFELTSDERAAYTTVLAGAVGRFLDHFLPSSATEGVWLLDAMVATAAETSAAAAAELGTKRTSGGWNAKAGAWLSARPPSVRARASALLDAGIATPPAPLTFTIGPPNAGVGRVAPVSIAGAPIDGEWIAAPAPFDWSADAADVLRLEGVFTLRVGALVAFGADRAPSPKPSVAAALAEAVDCAGLADALVGASGTSYSGCNRACTTALCSDALVARVRAAAAATDQDGDHPTLGIIASASATLGERAEILSFEGTAPSTFTAAAGATPVGLHAKIKGAPRK